MKTMQFVIFIAIVLLVYGLVNYYIFARGLQAMPQGTSARIWYITGFWMLAACFVAARFLERSMPCTFTEVITWIGSLWLGAMLFLFLSVALIDIFRVLNHFFHIFPASFYTDYSHTKLVAFFIVVGFTSIQLFAGYLNARMPRVVKMDIHISKPLGGKQPLRVVMASDIHLGTIIGKRKADQLVSMINRQNPDIILLAGDVVDEDIAPVIRKDIGASLIKLSAPLGVYGITGNHEYIGGAEKAVKYLQEHNINYLRDTFVLVDNRFILAGRDDKDKERFTGKPRKTLEEVMNGVDPSYPVILMDHQPFNLENVAKLGVDLQVSGHTHHGQIWPFNYITKAIYTLSWGYKKIGNTQFYVSCGFGTWGPPIRLGNRPEIVVFDIYSDSR
jgi:uncharacterized protein